MTYSLRAVLVATGFLALVSAAGYYPKRANLTDGPISFYSSTNGPSVEAVSFSWYKKWSAVTVGTVMVTVNEATNQTSSTTIYHSEFIADGSSTIFSRTDTNQAGTVTAVITDVYHNTVTLTYPTHHVEPSDIMTWDAILPTLFAPVTYTFGNDSVTTYTAEDTCCSRTKVLSSAPSHVPIKQERSTVDTNDPSGWMYQLAGRFEWLGPTDMSSTWAPQTLAFLYTGCPYTYCPMPPSSVNFPAEYVVAQANLLATSTTTISIADSSSDPSTDKSTATKQIADPVNQTPTAPSQVATATPTNAASQAAPEAAPTATQAQVTAQTQPGRTTTPDASPPSASNKANQGSSPASQNAGSATSVAGIGGYIISALGGGGAVATTTATSASVSGFGGNTGTSVTKSGGVVLQSTSEASSMHMSLETHMFTCLAIWVLGSLF